MGEKTEYEKSRETVPLRSDTPYLCCCGCQKNLTILADEKEAVDLRLERSTQSTKNESAKVSPGYHKVSLTERVQGSE